MAGIFKTIGSALSAVDTLTSSGARRLSVWSREQETKTKYRHVSAMMTIKREAAEELSAELKATKAVLQDQEVVEAFDILNALDAQKED